ncbi:sigma-54-dependent transcriptional regulator [Candidatus Uabimicrobium amorphum]|uniref:Sigma-54-dependent Fis family transcriptional regulator n=1 Tax=Uabimicrobium amorphum TaxID=2596890 RepID=A0A5S9IUW6_UABAM|nr:sigma-54 dependent transcriptional regulator [Candidatus Uabimicrobium amorphum]BBM87570.1 sigma-54-dependent Fis family transcriptional regulator [Candidatus Uabimicrobium amorphum]
MTKKVLVIDDDTKVLRLFQRILEKDYNVVTCSTMKESMTVIDESVDLVVADLNLQDGSGLDLLAYLNSLMYYIPFIVVTGYGTIESAVNAVKSGAVEYIIKPFSRNYILDAIRNAITEAEYRKNIAPEIDANCKEIIGQSKAMKKLFNILQRAAPSSATILIQGESGTGKELIARAIHNNSPRHKAEFVPINCAAFSENLLENELFGHVKGAFTGAMDYKEGIFEVANNGTLLLDEIGDMPMPLQIKLLRVLQEREYKPVGCTKYRKVNIRVIASTNVDLKKAIEEKKFREDLYYRLAVIELHVPPLRDRLEDLPLLVTHFIKKYNEKNSKNIESITPQAIEELKKHNWTGNIRELENAIERSVTLSTSNVITHDVLWSKKERPTLPNNFVEEILSEIDTSVSAKSLKDLVDIVTKNAILYALKKTKGNRSQAAAILKMGRASFYNKIKELDIK